MSTIKSKPASDVPSSLEIAIKAMIKVRDTRAPGHAREAMDRMIDIAISHLELDPIVEMDVYAQGFKDGIKIRNN